MTAPELSQNPLRRVPKAYSGTIRRRAAPPAPFRPKRQILLALLSTLIAYAPPTLAQEQFELAWPVACKVGESCEIQHYVDHGTGTVAQDYRCGTATYQGHNGTDIRLPTMADEQAGVDVLAAAPGKVLRTRDDMPDVSTRTTGRRSVAGRECGNGLVIAHSNGYETQYCHMAADSIVVKSGDLVSSGQKLGRVGLSGDTEFPHLHITVRQNGKTIDPFAVGEAEGACGGGVSLWKTDLRQWLQYKAGAVLNAGFAPRPVTMEDIERGVGSEPLRPDSPAIVAFVRAILLRKGDVQRMTLTGPDGLLVDHTEAPLGSNKDQIFMGIGRKRPAPGWRGRYVLREICRDQRRHCRAREELHKLCHALDSSATKDSRMRLSGSLCSRRRVRLSGVCR